MADEDILGKYIVGMNYPCSKQDIVSQAQQNGASEGVMKLLQNLPEKELQSADEVTGAMTKE